MKTLFSLMVLLLLSVLSCNAQGRKIDPSQLPEGAHTFLKEHFPNQTIIHASKDWEHGEKGFEVWLSNGTEVEFWKDGSYREVDGHWQTDSDRLHSGSYYRLCENEISERENHPYRLGSQRS